MEALGVNWKILLGQIINFAILFFLLKKFAFKPFFNLLETRKKHIEDGIKKAEEAEKSLQKIRVLEGEIRKGGEDKAKEIIKEAESTAENRAKEILFSADRDKKKILDEAKVLVQKEILEGKEQQKKEVLELTFLLTEKFLKEKFTADKDKKLLGQILSEIK